MLILIQNLFTHTKMFIKCQQYKCQQSILYNVNLLTCGNRFRLIITSLSFVWLVGINIHIQCTVECTFMGKL